jgi:hypothetical protein
MVSKLAHTIKSAVLSLSFSTVFLFPLDSGFNTHLPVYFSKVVNTHVFAYSTFRLPHVLVTFTCKLCPGESTAPATIRLLSLWLLAGYWFLLYYVVSLNEVPAHERKPRAFHWHVTSDPTMWIRSLLLPYTTSKQRAKWLTDWLVCLL